MRTHYTLALTVSQHLEYREDSDRLYHTGKVMLPYHLARSYQSVLRMPSCWVRRVRAASTDCPTHRRSTHWHAAVLGHPYVPEVDLLFLVSGKKAEVYGVTEWPARWIRLAPPLHRAAASPRAVSYALCTAWRVLQAWVMCVLRNPLWPPRPWHLIRVV